MKLFQFLVGCSLLCLGACVTPKNIEFTIIKDSASELDIASNDTFISSAPIIPFFFMISIEGLM